MTITTFVQATDVVDPWSFACYAQQKLGTPLPTGVANRTLLNVNLKRFWEANPRATWRNLAAIVDWCVTKRKHPTTAWNILRCFPSALKDGYVVLEDVVDEQVESGITRALQVETDENWRRMLIGSQGRYRGEVLAEWRRARR